MAQAHGHGPAGAARVHLLHQVLQWHHLLSGVDAVRDLRTQIMADGAFHALMYALGGIGLWMLYQSRKEFTGIRADRTLLAGVLIGFGVWHVIDAVASHWLTGIHRIRMDVPEPLVYDIAWLALFGLPPLVVGLIMRRRYPREVALPERRGHVLAISLAVLTLLAGGWASLPPAGVQGVQTVTVILRPDVSPGEFLSSLDGQVRLLWNDRAGGVWVLTGDDSPWSHYRRGAMYVSGSMLPAGCSAWIAPAAARRAAA